MRLGYCTQGLMHLDPVTAITLMAELGYRSVQLALHPLILKPGSESYELQTAAIVTSLRQYLMPAVIDATGPYLLSTTPGEPSFLSGDTHLRARRIRLISEAIETAAKIGAECVVISSGPLPAGADTERLLDRLGSSLHPLINMATRNQIDLALQPERGMFVDNNARFERLLQWLDDAPLMLSMNVGNCYVQGEMPLARYIDRLHPRLANVVLQDRRSGDPRPQPPGEGEMSFRPIIDALNEVNYDRGIHVDVAALPGEEVRVAAATYAFLTQIGA